MTMSPVNHGSNGRLERGQFAPGNRFASGNPNHKRMYDLRARLLDAVDEEAMARIGKKLVELAESGDLEAVKILFGYVIGRPAPAVEVTGEDGGPLVHAHRSVSGEALDRAERQV